MFIKIDSVNYFVLVNGKSNREIYEELVSRMSISKISESQKTKIMMAIKEQVKR